MLRAIWALMWQYFPTLAESTELTEEARPFPGEIVKFGEEASRLSTYYVIH